MQIKSPITLRIKQAEILESQLSGDDLSALIGAGGINQRPAVCPKVYCEAGYSSGGPGTDTTTTGS